MKQVLLSLFSFLLPVLIFSQQIDTIPGKKRLAAIKDTQHLLAKDTISSKHPEIVKAEPDSIAFKKKIIIDKTALYDSAFKQLLRQNRFLNVSGKPVAMTSRAKTVHRRDGFFFVLASIMLALGFFRFFYTRYFNNLFRVFFNASLRQTQLTDQLLQAKLPSLFFNILFLLSGGVYIYLLLRYYNWVTDDNLWPVVFYCIGCLAIIYILKWVTVKFTGWLTGYQPVTDIYIFVIFLINKILGILLIPFSIIIAFSLPALITTAVVISLLLTGLLFLLRFFRSYGLLQHQLKISRFHFLLYVFGIEILPVLLIYKGLVLLLSKNL